MARKKSWSTRRGPPVATSSQTFVKKKASKKKNAKKKLVEKRLDNLINVS